MDDDPDWILQDDTEEELFDDDFWGDQTDWEVADEEDIT